MAKKQKKNRLFNLEALETSFVPEGVNGRKLLVTKSLEEGQMDEILKELLESGIDNEALLDEKIEKSLPEEIRNDKVEVAKQKSTMKAAVKLITNLKKRLPEGDRDKLLKQLGDMTGLDDVKKEADPKVPAPEPKAPVAKEVTEEPKEPVKKENEMDPILKERLDKLDLVLKSNEDLATENKTLKEEVKKERDIRIEKEFLDKADKEYGRLGNTQEVAKILKSASEDMDDKSFKSLETILKSAAAQAEVAALFQENGSSVGLSNDLDTKVAVKKEAIMKEHPKMSPEAAEAKVFEDNPDLYQEYNDNNPAQMGGH